MKQKHLFMKGVLAVALVFALALAACDAGGVQEIQNVTTDVPKLNIAEIMTSEGQIGYDLYWQPVYAVNIYEVWRIGNGITEPVVGLVKSNFVPETEGPRKGYIRVQDIVDFDADGNQTLVSNTKYTYELIAFPIMGNVRDSNKDRKDVTTKTIVAEGTPLAAPSFTLTINGDKREISAKVTPPASGVIVPGMYIKWELIDVNETVSAQGAVSADFADSTLVQPTWVDASKMMGWGDRGSNWELPRIWFTGEQVPDKESEATPDKETYNRTEVVFTRWQKDNNTRIDSTTARYNPIRTWYGFVGGQTGLDANNKPEVKEYTLRGYCEYDGTYFKSSAMASDTKKYEYLFRDTKRSLLMKDVTTASDDLWYVGIRSQDTLAVDGLYAFFDRGNAKGYQDVKYTMDRAVANADGSNSFDWKPVYLVRSGNSDSTWDAPVTDGSTPGQADISGTDAHGNFITAIVGDWTLPYYKDADKNRYFYRLKGVRNGMVDYISLNDNSTAPTYQDGNTGGVYDGVRITAFQKSDVWMQVEKSYEWVAFDNDTETAPEGGVNSAVRYTFQPTWGNPFQHKLDANDEIWVYWVQGDPDTVFVNENGQGGYTSDNVLKFNKEEIENRATKSFAITLGYEDSAAAAADVDALNSPTVYELYAVAFFVENGKINLTGNDTAGNPKTLVMENSTHVRGIKEANPPVLGPFATYTFASGGGGTYVDATVSSDTGGTGSTGTHGTANTNSGPFSQYDLNFNPQADAVFGTLWANYN